MMGGKGNLKTFTPSCEALFVSQPVFPDPGDRRLRFDVDRATTTDVPGD